MKALVCEMCGSTDLVKQDGVFVCQSCGTKYSVEEAKKLMSNTPVYVEGKVEVTGEVKIDKSEDLAKQYIVARRVKETGNYELAYKIYEEILVKDPNNWEPHFYSVYCRSMTGRIIDIDKNADNISNIINQTLIIINENIIDNNEKRTIINEIATVCISAAKMFCQNAKDHFNGIDSSIREQYEGELKFRLACSSNIVYLLGDSLDSLYKGEYKDISLILWKEGRSLYYYGNKEFKKQYIMKIRRYEPDYYVQEERNQAEVRKMIIVFFVLLTIGLMYIFYTENVLDSSSQSTFVIKLLFLSLLIPIGRIIYIGIKNK